MSVNIVFFSDMWCGVLNVCPVKEGDNVTVGCYAQYDWLAYLLQYNPIVTINSTLMFLEYPESSVTTRPEVPRPPGPPAPVNLKTTYDIANVQAGDKVLANCTMRFEFDRSRAYSGRNTYANNSLEHTCIINQTVHCEYFLLGFHSRDFSTDRSFHITF